MVVCGEIVDNKLINIYSDAPLHHFSIKSISSMLRLLLNAPEMSQDGDPHIASKIVHIFYLLSSFPIRICVLYSISLHPGFSGFDRWEAIVQEGTIH